MSRRHSGSLRACILHAGHRTKAYGMSGVIHLLDKYALSNYYVLRVMTEVGGAGTKEQRGLWYRVKIRVYARI